MKSLFFAILCLFPLLCISFVRAHDNCTEPVVQVVGDKFLLNIPYNEEYGYRAANVASDIAVAYVSCDDFYCDLAVSALGVGENVSRTIEIDRTTSYGGSFWFDIVGQSETFVLVYYETKNGGPAAMKGVILSMNLMVLKKFTVATLPADQTFAERSRCIAKVGDRFVVSWANEYENDNHFSIYSSDGMLVKGPITMVDKGPCDVFGVNKNRFIMSCPVGEAMKGYIYTIDGAALVTITIPQSNFFISYMIAKHESGFVVTWSDLVGTTDFGYVQQFDFDGKEKGSKQVISEDANQIHSFPVSSSSVVFAIEESSYPWALRLRGFCNNELKETIGIAQAAAKVMHIFDPYQNGSLVLLYRRQDTFYGQRLQVEHPKAEVSSASSSCHSLTTRVCFGLLMCALVFILF